MSPRCEGILCGTRVSCTRRLLVFDQRIVLSAGVRQSHQKHVWLAVFPGVSGHRNLVADFQRVRFYTFRYQDIWARSLKIPIRDRAGPFHIGEKEDVQQVRCVFLQLSETHTDGGARRTLHTRCATCGESAVHELELQAEVWADIHEFEHMRHRVRLFEHSKATGLKEIGDWRNCA